MWVYPSLFVTALSAILLLLIVVDRSFMHEAQSPWIALALLVLTIVQGAFYAARGLIIDRGLDFVGVVLSVLASVFLATLWRARVARKRALRAAAPSVPPPPPAKSPATRLQEIKTEMHKLDAERRELEQHPDANRF